MKFSPRYLTGFGLTDGEWMERLWSYLGGFVKVTGAMSKSCRLLTLTSALKHFKKEKMMTMGKVQKKKALDSHKSFLNQ
jgi:hypothetical protein